MANVFLSLDVPAGVGVGAASDCLGLASRKTIEVGGGSFFIASLTVEASHDGVNWTSIATFSGPNSPKVVDVAARYLRVRITTYASGSPDVIVSAQAASVEAFAMAVPAGNGAGVAIDATQYGVPRTFYVSGTFTGSVTIEGSNDNDGSSWSPCATIRAGEHATIQQPLRYHRVVRANVNGFTPGLPVVGACFERSVEDSARTDSGLLDVYVDGALGDDGNDGLSESTALATIQEVYRKFPLHYYNGASIRVNLAGVGGFGADATTWQSYIIDDVYCYGGNGMWRTTYQYVGPEMVPAWLTTGPTIATADAVPCVAIAGGSPKAGGTLAARFDFTGAAPGWTDDDMNGYFLRVTRAGEKVCWELPISTNTADTIIVLMPVAGLGFLDTDTYEIVVPGAMIWSDNPAQDYCVGIHGEGGQQPFMNEQADARGLLSNFCRIALSSSAGYGWQGSQLHGNNLGFDRCRLPYCFANNASGWFVLCTSDFMELDGWKTAGSYGTWPTETSPTDPPEANRDYLVDLAIVYEGALSLAWDGGYVASHYLIHHGLSFYTWGGYEVALWVGTASTIDVDWTVRNSAYKGFVQGYSATGNGPAIRCGRNGAAFLKSNVARPGMTSMYNMAGGLPLKVDQHAGIDYGNGAGEWEEVAGFNGCYHDLPLAPGSRGSLSIIRTNP